MTTNPTIWSFIIHASIIVKLVMVILIAASVTSWAIICQRRQQIKYYKKAMDEFQNRFNQSEHMSELYASIKNGKTLQSKALLFQEALKEFFAHPPQSAPTDQQIQQIKRVMQIKSDEEITQLSEDINWLASIGSTTPYIGLLGTVWGIMTSFQALSHVTQATIAMVAPGISEALIATAMGLFAAIPAVLSYNFFQHQIDGIELDLEGFQQQVLASIVRHQIIKENH